MQYRNFFRTLLTVIWNTLSKISVTMDVKIFLRQSEIISENENNGKLSDQEEKEGW